MRGPIGIVDDDGWVMVRDQADANRLYNKGYAGVPQKGGALRLSIIEAARLVEEERLHVLDDKERRLSFQHLFEIGMGQDPAFEIPFFAYRDLRARGFVARHANRSTLDLLVYGRGDAPPKAKPAWLAAARSERAPIGANILQDWLAAAATENADLVALIVDEEGDLTHYRITDDVPSGSMRTTTATDSAMTGVFFEDRVMMWDERAADILRKERFMGQRLPGGLQLSLVEAASLIDADTLECPGFWDRAEKVQPDLRLRMVAYRDLTRRGLYVKTGFKFGTHFRAYADDPRENHAPWLVHIVDPEWTSSWPEVSRAVRLAAAVRKTLLFAIVDHRHASQGGDAEATVRYVAIERFRP